VKIRRRRRPLLRPLKKWTKGAIREMTGALDGFVLNLELYRPLAAIGHVIETKRLEVVRVYLQDHRRMFVDRVKQNRATALHYRDHFRDLETFQRFEGYAREAWIKALRIAQILKKLETEPLPPEVVDYKPVRFR